MANKKSSKKDLRRTAKRTVANREVKSSLKTYVKKAKVAASTGEAAPTQSALSLAIKALDKAVQRGVIHKNQAARRKSRIAKAAHAAILAGPVAPVEKKERAVKTGKLTAKEAAKARAIAGKAKAEAAEVESVEGTAVAPKTAAKKAPAAKPAAKKAPTPAAKKPTK